MKRALILNINRNKENASSIRPLIINLLRIKKLITLLTVTVISSSAFCKTITVTSSADSGAGTLRQAIADADSTSIDEIVFEDSITTITLIDQIDIDKSLIITGNTVNTTVLKRNGNGTDNKKHFHIMTAIAVILNNLTLQDSYTYCSGGAIDNFGKLTLNNCVLKNNKSVNWGGAIYSEGQLYANKCTFNNNSSVSGGAVSSSQTSFDGCTFKKNSSLNSGTAISIGPSTIKNCEFEGNSGNAAIITNSGLTKINNCIFMKNSSSKVIDNRNEIVVSNSVFLENTGRTQIVLNTKTSTFSLPVVTIINCVFYKNILTDPTLYSSGIISNARVGTLNIINSTIVNNLGVGLACPIDPYFEECFNNIYLYNNIFYNNISANGNEYDIYLANLSDLTSNTQGMLSNSFNNIIGTTNLPFNATTNFLNVDPLFVDSTNNDYSLQESSPAIDAGNNSFYSYSNYPKDILSNYRIDNSTIDIGAYEYQSGNPLLNTKNANGNRLKIFAVDRNIVISDTNKLVYIYNLQGICISHGTSSVFTVPSSGIYIVRVEDAVQKVIVK